MANLLRRYVWPRDPVARIREESGARSIVVLPGSERELNRATLGSPRWRNSATVRGNTILSSDPDAHT
jgi:hypothetical protein